MEPTTRNTIQQHILSDESAEFVSIDTGNGAIGKLKVLTLTTKGEGIVTANGGTVRATGPAGIIHELWRSRLRDRCGQHEYTVTEEFHLGDRKRVDLHAIKNGRVVLIEVETGNSDVLANIRKATGQTLVVFFTNENAYRAARPHLPADIIVLKPDTIDLHHVLRDT